MKRILIFAYGVTSYVICLGAFLYLAAFLGNLFVPRSIDAAPVGPLWESLLVNTLLLGAFALQHSVMARPRFNPVRFDAGDAGHPQAGRDTSRSGFDERIPRMIEITVNGERKTLLPPISVRELIDHIGLDPRKVAAEVNCEIVPSTHHAERLLRAGDAVEIVTLVGGAPRRLQAARGAA
jgi:thiamine biosynthesis protein ThiS